MTLSEAILNANNYEDTEENAYAIFAKRINGIFQPNSDAVILELTAEELEMDMNEIARIKCPEFYYFLEMFVLKDIYEDMMNVEEYKSDAKKVERIIYYAEFDA